MANTPEIHDLRSGFWKDHFQRGQDYETYLRESDPAKAQRWRDLEAHLPALTPDQQARLQGFGRTLNVLLYSGVWCGDCVRQGPMIRRIAQAAGANVTLRVIDREASPPLKEELRVLGGARVPVAVFLSEDFFEVGRFGDRLLWAYRIKAKRELGPACPTGLIVPPPDELTAEMADWVDTFERMLLMVRMAAFLRTRHGD